MKTIIEEAINAFQLVHDDRCLLHFSKCGHQDLIRRAKDYEKGVETRIASEVAGKLEEVKNDWLAVKEIPDGSLASWIAIVFDVAIKFCEEM